MTRSEAAVLGLIVLGVAAVGAFRELSPGAKVLSVQPAGTPRPLPDLRFVDATGAPRAVADFRGRMILLNVWATWCPPCRKEMPALDRLQTALGGPDFEVVALSTDRGGPFVVKSFYEALDLRALRIYVDQSGEALTMLGAAGIPVTLLVDRDGRELWRVLGPVAWAEPAVVNRIRGYLADAPERAAPDE